MPEIEGFMIEVALYHGFREDSDNDDGVTDYRCSRATLLKLMLACVKQGEDNAKVKAMNEGSGASAAFVKNLRPHKMSVDDARTAVAAYREAYPAIAAIFDDKLDKIIEQTKPKSFEIEVGPSLSPPSALGMGYDFSAALINKVHRITELQKEIDRVLEDKRKMYEPPTLDEVISCANSVYPFQDTQKNNLLNWDLKCLASRMITKFVELRKASTTYDNRPKPVPEKIAEPTETEIENVRAMVADAMGLRVHSEKLPVVIRESLTRFVELRNKA